LENSKRKDVLRKCLDTFVTKGLAKTTSRDLSAALELQSGGLYYYFKTKDDAVIACAEEAALMLEQNLILPCLLDLSDPEALIEKLRRRADELSPTMRFFTNVCATEKYREQLAPKIEGLNKRYKHYAYVFAGKLSCRTEEIEPYVYMAITAVSSYMMFGNADHIASQMNLLKEKLYEINERSPDYNTVKEKNNGNCRSD